MNSKNLYIYNKKEYKQKFSNTILKSHKIYLKKNLNKIDNDFNIRLTNREYKRILSLINETFLYLVNRLEKYHKKKFNRKFWKILILPWLDNIIPNLYLKWIHLRKIDTKHLTHLYDYNQAKFISESFGDLDFNNNLDYNKWTVSEIIKYQKKKKFKKKKVIFQKILKKNFPFYYKFIFFLLNILYKNIKYKFIIKGLGLGKLKYILFYIKLKNLPIPLIETNYKFNKIDLQKRKKYFLINKKRKSFSNFFKGLLIYLIPKNYLENFENIREAVRKSYWPKNVKSVIVGQDYYFNDFFKFWISNQSLYGTKLFIMQHGGRIGTEKFITNEYIQKLISDFFLTWGWNQKRNSKVYPFFCTYFEEKLKYKRRYTLKKIYFCQSIFPDNYGHVDGSPLSFLKKNENYEYANQLYNNFKNNIKINFIVRYLGHLSKKKSYHFYSLNKNITTDRALKKLSKIINYGKIFIHDQDSTAFLETLLYNVPTLLIFKNSDYKKLRKDSIAYYKILENSGIIQNSVENISNFINNNYHNIDSWWFSKKVQVSRKIFVKKYINTSRDSVSLIINFLNLNEKKNYKSKQ